jgi:hypothetical protein
VIESPCASACISEDCLAACDGVSGRLGDNSASTLKLVVSWTLSEMDIHLTSKTHLAGPYVLTGINSITGS